MAGLAWGYRLWSAGAIAGPEPGGLSWTVARATRNDRRLLRIGLVGSLLTALCCFTPLLVAILGGLGLGALVGGLDFVLFPALLGFLALTLYAWLRLRRS